MNTAGSEKSELNMEDSEEGEEEDAIVVFDDGE